MKQFLGLILATVVVASIAHAEELLGATTTLGVSTTGVAAVIYQPALLLPISTTALGIYCAGTTYFGDFRGFFKCIFSFPAEGVKGTSDGIKGSSDGLGLNSNNAVIEAAQEDVLNVVAGNEAQFPLVKDLIAFEQNKVQKQQGISLTKVEAAVQVYEGLQSVKAK